MELPSVDEPECLASYKAILGVALPAALFRVSWVLSTTLQTSLVSRHGGTDMLAAFACVGVTTKTASLLFAFMADGVAAKVGRSSAHEPASALRTRVRLYLCSCLVLGAVAAAVLLMARRPLMHAFHLSPAVQELARPYWSLLSALVPLALLNMALGGTLQGLHRVGTSAALEAAAAVAEVGGAYWALTATSCLPAGLSRLQALGIAKWVVAACYAALGLLLVAAFLPSTAAEQGRARAAHSGRPGARAGDQTGALRMPLLVPAAPAALPAAAAAAAERAGPHVLPGGAAAAQGQQRLPLLYTWELVKELACDGANVMVRSIVVQGSMWLTAVAAARLGSAALGAHQILTQLWQLPSHFLGGFAVGGIVLGSRMAPAGPVAEALSTRRARRRLSCRLLLLSSLLGFLVCCALLAWREPAASFFHPHADVAAPLLGPAWETMCVMQVLTPALFTLTGLIYGAQCFSYLRNVLLVGFLGVFCPALLWVVRQEGGAVGSSVAAGLGAVWNVKLAFYVWQLVAEGMGVARAYGYMQDG